MPNMSPKKVPMPEQDPNVRIKNFLEVALDIPSKWQWKKLKGVLTASTTLCFRLSRNVKFLSLYSLSLRENLRKPTIK